MIKNKGFELLLNEIKKIEGKIIELKISGRFYEARLYETALSNIQKQAKSIFEDEELDDNAQSLVPLRKLLELETNLDYYLMRINNFIEPAQPSNRNYKAVQKVQKKWDELKQEQTKWDKEEHNPIEQVEHDKEIARKVVGLLIASISVEGVVDLTMAAKYASYAQIAGVIKELFFDVAEKLGDKDLRQKYIDLAKNLDPEEVVDYKLWQELAQTQGVEEKNVEVIYKPKYKKETSFQMLKSEEDVGTALVEWVPDDGIWRTIINFFNGLLDNSTQKRMEKNWEVPNRTPAFKNILMDETTNYEMDFINKDIVENTRKLYVASPVVGKYNFEKGSQWYGLEELVFCDKVKRVHSKQDQNYSYIGSDAFENCESLESIDFGRIEMIGERSFKNCTNLRKVIFSNTIKSIGKDAFKGCKKLKSVEFTNDLDVYILDRPQTILDCFDNTDLREMLFPKIENIYNYAIVDCPKLENIYVADIACMAVPFKMCKYVFGKEEGIVSFVSKTALELWKKRNSSIRFFELTEEEKEFYKAK